MKKTRPIGEVFEANGKQLVVKVPDNSWSCVGCYLNDRDSNVEDDPLYSHCGECVGDLREDRTDVIFAEVKNGEES